MTPRDKALAAIRTWYDALPRPKKEAKGTITARLVLLERLKNTFDLNLASHLTPGGGQIRELSGEAVKKILDPAQSTRQFIADLLELAEKTDKRGLVAQHLVGAKLQLRFPAVEVRKEPCSAADAPSGHPGDFVVEDTAFHVTVAPTADHFEKCKWTIRNDIISNKTDPAPESPRNRWRSGREHILFLTKCPTGYRFKADAVRVPYAAATLRRRGGGPNLRRSQGPRAQQCK